ncbi:MAG: peptidylprolyl isomerase [Phycisphaerales bacterium]|nr:peptidylprolyl isomerase [Phycisphaerales bacterium]
MPRTTLMMLALVGTIGALTACHHAGRAEAEEQGGCIHIVMSTSEGEIKIELDPDRAPITVANFLKYADRGAYDGTTFHRVVEGFVIQGGGWTPDLHERAKADAAAGRKDQPIRNEWRNGMKNTRGTIAMARDAGPDTATREFYINVQDNPKLDTGREQTGNAGYAVFGWVADGMDVVDRIRHMPTSPREVGGVTDGSMANVPVTPVVITSVRRAQTAAKK